MTKSLIMCGDFGISLAILLTSKHSNLSSQWTTAFLAPFEVSLSSRLSGLRGAGWPAGYSERRKGKRPVVTLHCLHTDKCLSSLQRTSIYRMRIDWGVV